MTSDSLQELRNAVAQLLDSPTTDLTFEKITDGLSHHSFVCKVGEKSFYVKVYELGPNPAKIVTEINRTTELMRKNAIPAPEIVAYSLQFPNLVIHKFVDAQRINWDPAQVSPVAKLYSDVALIALQEKKFISKVKYLLDLQHHSDIIEQQVMENISESSELNQRAFRLIQEVLSQLTQKLPENPILVLKLHDDFTEKNILAEGGEIKLLCDWDSYRARVFWEHLAGSVARFSTNAPMQGEMDQQRLIAFLNSLAPTVIQHIGDYNAFAQLFPFLAILRHLRMYRFRNLVVAKRRSDLRESLLTAPIEHCEWMLEQRQIVTAWMHDMLKAINVQPGPG